MLVDKSLSAVDPPSPDLLRSLYLDEAQNLEIAGCDIFQYYKRLHAPPEIIPLLGLPSVHATSVNLPCLTDRLTTCLSCIPMSVTFSAAWAQVVTVAVLRRRSLPVPDQLARLLDFKIYQGRNIVLPYIDDISIIGISPDKVTRDRLSAANALEAPNLHVDLKKDLFAGDADYKIAIGLAWWRDGMLTVKPAHALRLFRLPIELSSTKGL